MTLPRLSPSPFLFSTSISLPFPLPQLKTQEVLPGHGLLIGLSWGPATLPRPPCRRPISVLRLGSAAANAWSRLWPVKKSQPKRCHLWTLTSTPKQPRPSLHPQPDLPHPPPQLYIYSVPYPVSKVPHSSSLSCRLTPIGNMCTKYLHLEPYPNFLMFIPHLPSPHPSLPPSTPPTHLTSLTTVHLSVSLCGTVCSLPCCERNRRKCLRCASGGFSGVCPGWYGWNSVKLFLDTDLRPDLRSQSCFRQARIFESINRSWICVYGHRLLKARQPVDGRSVNACLLTACERNLTHTHNTCAHINTWSSQLIQRQEILNFNCHKNASLLIVALP